MSDFSCPVVQIRRLLPIPEADTIEHTIVFDCAVIVPKGRYQIGDFAIYVPPGAVLPDRLAESIKGAAKLRGERRNRSCAYQLRGTYSEGLLVGPLRGGVVGTDAAPMLGITKYEPPIPKSWRGECVHLPEMTIAYDIESVRRHPGVIAPGEPVELTEKIHGTFCAIGHFPRLENRELLGGDTLVYSKGLARTSHTLKASAEENLYVRTAMDLALRDRIRAAFNNRPATILGEIYGAKVQDLDYGLSEPRFALFDIYLGYPGRGHYLGRDELAHIAAEIAPTVPVVHRGEYRPETLKQMSSYPTLIGRAAHLSEGVVVRPLRERSHPRLGRVALKYVSMEYLARANATERV